MARSEDWRNEIADGLRREGWSLNGPTRIVKVVPRSRPLVRALRGFVCLEKSLVGKTPAAIESALGLPFNSLGGGCRIFRFKRLPMSFEVEYELTAKHPDGWAFNPAIHNRDYAPGDPTIHQWRLLVDVPAEHLLDLAPNERYPYLHG